MEKARHQEGISELHFVHFHPSEGSDLATAKRQVARRRPAVIESGKAGARCGGVYRSTDFDWLRGLEAIIACPGQSQRMTEKLRGVVKGHHKGVGSTDTLCGFSPRPRGRMPGQAVIETFSNLLLRPPSRYVHRRGRSEVWIIGTKRCGLNSDPRLKLGCVHRWRSHTFFAAKDKDRNSPFCILAPWNR